MIMIIIMIIIILMIMIIMIIIIISGARPQLPAADAAPAALRERGSAPKGGRHSTICVYPQWKLCLSSAHLCSGSLMV